MNCFKKLLAITIVIMMWSPVHASYRISEEQRSKPLPTPPGVSQFYRPDRPKPPAPKAQDSMQHVAEGPTIPLSQVKLAHQETAQEMAERSQDLERLKRMQRIEKTLGLDVELRPQAEAGAEGGKGAYKAEWTSSASSGVKSKLAQEDREALKKEYDELKKIDEQRRTEIRAKAIEPDEAIIQFEEKSITKKTPPPAPERPSTGPAALPEKQSGLKPSEAAAAQRAARKQQPSDEVSARDIQKMGRDEALRQAEELDRQAQAARPPVPSRRPIAEEVKEEAAQPRQIKFTADDLSKIKSSVESSQKIDKIREEAMATPGFKEKYDAWIEKKEKKPQEPSKTESLKERFFSKTESTKNTLKDTAKNFKNKIFGLFGRGKKIAEEEESTITEKPSEKSPIIPQNIDIKTKWKKVPASPEMQAEIEKAKIAQLPPPAPEFLAPVEKKSEVESTGIKPSDKANRPTKDSSTNQFGAIKMTSEQVEQTRKKFGQPVAVNPANQERLDQLNTELKADYDRFSRILEKAQASNAPAKDVLSPEEDKFAAAYEAKIDEMNRIRSAPLPIPQQSSLPPAPPRTGKFAVPAKDTEAAKETTLPSNIPTPPPPPPVERIPPARPERPARPVAQQEEPESGRSDLMDQIRQGAQLKKLEPEEIKKPAKNLSSQEQQIEELRDVFSKKFKNARDDDNTDTEPWP